MDGLGRLCGWPENGVSVCTELGEVDPGAGTLNNFEQEPLWAKVWVYSQISAQPFYSVLIWELDLKELDGSL